MEYYKLHDIIIQKLRDELPGHLSYHSVTHVKDVIQAAESIAQNEGITGDTLTLIMTAALFHDTGFIYGSKNHEERSCEIAASYLPDYGYSDDDITLIQGMIMATKIPQSPQNHLEEILADADLDYLGRDDFFVIGDKLYEELAMFGIVQTENDWNSLQKKFLENHHYFTHTAISMRQQKKDENLAIIKNKLAQK